MSYIKRKEIIGKIEEMIDRDVLFIYTAKGHGKDAAIEDPMERIIERVLLKKKREKVLVVIETFGGDYNVAIGIMTRICNAYEDVVVAVYDQAKSVGTFMALFAQKILMATNAQLGPIDIVGNLALDTESESFPIQEIGDILKESNPNLEPNGLLEEAICLAGIKMRERYYKECIEPLVKKKCTGGCEFLISKGSHYAPIFYDYAKSIGLNVEKMDVALENLLRELVYSVEDEFDEFKQQSSSIFLGQGVAGKVKNLTVKLCLIESLDEGYIRKVDNHIDEYSMKVYPVKAGWEKE